MMSAIMLDEDGQISVALWKATVGQNSFVRAKNLSAHREMGIMVWVKKAFMFKNQHLVIKLLAMAKKVVVVVVEQWFFKGGTEICVQHRKSFFRSSGQTKVVWQWNENKLAPWSVNDLSWISNELANQLLRCWVGRGFENYKSLQSVFSCLALVSFRITATFCERACLGLIKGFYACKIIISDDLGQKFEIPLQSYPVFASAAAFV